MLPFAVRTFLLPINREAITRLIDDKDNFIIGHSLLNLDITIFPTLRYGNSIGTVFIDNQMKTVQAITAIHMLCETTWEQSSQIDHLDIKGYGT